MADTSLNRTPLHDLHRSLGAKMVPFAGYHMPVQYAAGIMAEHLHTRAKAGLFPCSARKTRAPSRVVPRRNEEIRREHEHL